MANSQHIYARTNIDIVKAISWHVVQDPVIYTRLAMVNRDFYTVFTGDPLWDAFDVKMMDKGIFKDFLKQLPGFEKIFNPPVQPSMEELNDQLQLITSSNDYIAFTVNCRILDRTLAAMVDSPSYNFVEYFESRESWTRDDCKAVYQLTLCRDLFDMQDRLFDFHNDTEYSSKSARLLEACITYCNCDQPRKAQLAQWFNSSRAVIEDPELSIDMLEMLPDPPVSGKWVMLTGATMFNTPRWDSVYGCAEIICSRLGNIISEQDWQIFVNDLKSGVIKTHKV